MTRLLVIALLFVGTDADSAHAQEISVPALIEAGDVAFAALDNETALRNFEAAREQGGETLSFELLARLSRVHTDYSLDLIEAGDREQAKEQMDAALDYALRLEELHPDRAETWFLLAIANGNLAEFEGGRGKVRIGRAVEEYCLRAMEIDPQYAPPYIVLGVFHREVSEVSWIQRLVANTLFGGLPKGSYESSAELLRTAVELDPRIPLAQFELGRTLFRSKLLEEARPFLVTGATLPPMSTLDIRNAREAMHLLEQIPVPEQDCSVLTVNIADRTVAGTLVDMKVDALEATIGSNRVTKTSESLEGEPSPVAVLDFCGHELRRHWNGLSWTDPAFRTGEDLGVGMALAAFDSTYGVGMPTWSEAGVVVAYPVGEREFFLEIDQSCVAETDAFPPEVKSRECSATAIWIPLLTLPD